MRFKVDENLPQEITDILREIGYDAFSVRDQKLSGADDTVIISVCKAEQRALITLDTDFLDIRRFPPEEYCGIVVMRLASQDKDHVISVFESNLFHFSLEPLDKCLWVIEEHKLRIKEPDSF